MDTLRPEDEADHNYESLFHLNADEAILNDASKIVTTQNADANLVLYPLITEDLNVEVVKGVEDEPVQGWANYSWRPVPTAVFRRSGPGITRFVTLVYPLSADTELPVESAETLLVTADGAPSPDALAFRIRFAGGQTHVFLYADTGGINRRYGQFETQAAVELMKLSADGKNIGIFRYLY